MLQKPRYKTVSRALQIFLKHNNSIIRSFTTETHTIGNEKEKELERIARDASIDNPPTACCRSGCSNCVFIVWAESLANKMTNAGPEISEKILKMVDDPSMRAYLELELRLRGLKK